MTILATVTAVTFMAFSTVIKAWRKGTALSEKLHRGDYVVEQLAMGLRSTYFPEVKGGATLYGFQFTDGGDGMGAGDSFSWVKVGTALVGKHCPFAGTPHRVEFLLQNTPDGRKTAAVRAWRLQGQPEDFDPKTVEPVLLPSKIVGVNCRMAWRKLNDEIEWLDEWKETNRVPTVVELTFTLEPLEPGDDPLEIKRIVGIPVGPLSWQ